ncbi:type II and III secretion system protein [Pseudoalteromonas sp. NEC-BIFX-2020_002]|uniref:type II and III secretion system protein family protein n=1 Tax=Pseudoalteromonas sp. NEC-BIFX-2020_002 TaxID=2732353 RepID=UPI0014775885|nr:pilus assembly protein N-terminal domain-containing protein [Pseudoalteromonas sp. NEC-BIFX-2020_002]NNG43697.1 type II and III secretion system protein [Pseudoalteromonas sp. NEC-BIFX-2020_002]
MRRIVQLFTIILVLCSPPLFGATPTNINMKVGTLNLLPIEDIKRIAVASPGVVSAKVIDNNSLLLIAEAAGETQIQVWNKNDEKAKLNIKVNLIDNSALIDRVKELISNLQGVSIREVGDLVVLEGKVDKATSDKVASIAKLIPNLTSLVTINELEIRQMIRMDVKIVEIGKKTLKNIGVKWGTSASGPAFGAISNWTSNDLFSAYSPSTISDSIVDQIGGVLIGSNSFSHFGIVTGLTSQIQLLSEQGDARMLAQPTLSTRSGEKARFLAGGEIPIPLLSADGAPSVEFKEYGIKLEIEPVSDSHGNIVSYVSAEVSSVDPSVQVLGIPGFKTRETESVVSVKDGDTIVISGLVSSEMSKAVGKVPLLGSIPILGELFKSRDFADNKTELVILVTPHIVSLQSESHESRLKRAQEMIDTADKLEAFYILD